MPTASSAAASFSRLHAVEADLQSSLAMAGRQRMGGGGQRQVCASARVAEEIAARQEKVLIFTQFSETTEPLAAFLECVFGRPGLSCMAGPRWRTQGSGAPVPGG